MRGHSHHSHHSQNHGRGVHPVTTWRATRGDAESQIFRADPFASFSVTVSRLEGRVLVRVGGELDAYSSPYLRSTLLDLIDGQGNLALVIDLANLEFIDSTGLAVLVTALRQSRAHGGNVVLRQPRPSTMRLLRITAMDRVFAIE